MQNPSNTFPKKDSFKIDTTVQNVIKMAYICGYTKVVILNIKSLINGNPEEMNDYLIKNKKYNKTLINQSFIKDYLTKQKPNDSDFLIAWGSNKVFLQDFETAEFSKVLDNIYKWAYRINSTNTPTHPSSYNTRLVNQFLDKILEK